MKTKTKPVFFQGRFVGKPKDFCIAHGYDDKVTDGNAFIQDLPNGTYIRCQRTDVSLDDSTDFVYNKTIHIYPYGYWGWSK